MTKNLKISPKEKAPLALKPVGFGASLTEPNQLLHLNLLVKTKAIIKLKNLEDLLAT